LGEKGFWTGLTGLLKAEEIRQEGHEGHEEVAEGRQCTLKKLKKGYTQIITAALLSSNYFQD
jgi:hypothetical protein